jgi:acetyl-CoA synthetase
MLTEASDYETLYRDFRWDIPARFNIATACCDRHADGSGRLALIYIDEDGAATRTSFDAISDMSRRFANVLKADGLVRGDRVAVFCRSRWNCRSRIWRRCVPAWCRSRCSPCSARTRWNSG